MQEQEKTLTDLKTGDEVAIRDGMSESYHLLTVKSLSRGIIELENGNRYRVLNGTPLAKGSKWYRPGSIEPVTDAIKLVIKKNSLVNKLSGLNYTHWQRMDVELLQAIAALVWKDKE